MSAWMAWTRWFKRKGSVTTASGRKRRVPDFADYGTAFGLDMSLTPEVPPVARSAAVEGVKPPVVTPVTMPAR
ncbi:hypothetical protein [Leptothrix discophora]|uniref:Uncharacterized protein n=1 Tax=Leptothrix discophora TaxID=89 RepID=A0ABT9G8P4_LEPDI|nr:hypothetical protein [Leptothrix discophora]MDP4302862.1 hypothetical protein [Leptothrix discophora]